MMALFDKNIIQEMHDNSIREASREEGREEGHVEEILCLYMDGDITEEVALRRLNCSKEELDELASKYKHKQS